MEIKVLGTGCKKCKTLHERVRRVVDDNNIEATVFYEQDLFKIMVYNIIATPALVINEKVVSKGCLLSEKEILGFIKQ